MVWDKIKGLIVEDDAPKSAAPAAPVSTTLGGAASVAPANDEFVQALRASIKGRATAFTALLSAADKLAAIIPDATMRLKAAFATVSTEGRGVKEVLAAIEVHAADLESQRLQFDTAAEKAKSLAVNGLQAELDALGPSSAAAQSQIDGMARQIQQMQELLGRNAARSTELTTLIAQETTRFLSSKQQFEAALGTVKRELDGQKAVVLSALS